MAKPERHPWPYGPQWNYYPPHMLNFPKFSLPSGPQVNSDPNENYLAIRYPEPRRPYHVPYTSFTSYCHQENHPVGSYMQTNSVYTPKHYVYRPLPQENNNSYKVNENLQSYPACSNSYSLTKDQATCYQTTWNSTSHFPKNPPELDVRHFLATWQDKDDDFTEVSTENEQTQIYQGSDSIPLDCSKRNNTEKSIRKTYNDNYLNGQNFNPPSYFVQPYYLKEDTLPINRSIITEELNNNVLHRNNLNYGNNQSYTKNFYANSMKLASSKLLSYEHSLPYNQSINHCDINNSHLRNSVNNCRQKDNMIEASERSQYNLTSCLESGELFYDVNHRNEELQKPPVIHPLFNINTFEDQSYFGNENNEFSDNLMLSDFHSLKDSWDMFSSNVKVKDNPKMCEKPKSINKVSPQNMYERVLPCSNNNSNNSANSNTVSIAYEGAFNILPNIPVANPNNVQFNHSSTIDQSQEAVKPSVSTHSSISAKDCTNTTKPIQANTKIRPYQFNEEVSSEDIDISIASTGDFPIAEDSVACSTSVISFSKMKKEKAVEVLKCDSNKNSHLYSFSRFNTNNNAEKKSALLEEISVQNTKYSPKPEEMSINPSELEKNISKTNDIERSEISKYNNKPNDSNNTSYPVKGDAMDLSVLKTQNSEASELQTVKNELCYLDMPNNYFSNSSFDQKRHKDFSDTSTIEGVEVVNQSYQNSKQKIDTPGIEINGNCDWFGNSETVKISKSTETLCSTNEASFNTDNNANDNLLLLAQCSQEYACQIKSEVKSLQEKELTDSLIVNTYSNKEREEVIEETHLKNVRDSVIKCSLRWDRIFNIMSNEGNTQTDMSLDLGPAKVELRLPAEHYSSSQWKIVEAENSKLQPSSIVQVKRLILKRKNQCEERIPKMIIKKTEGQEYRSYLKRELNEAVLQHEKIKLDSEKSSTPKNIQILDP